MNKNFLIIALSICQFMVASDSPTIPAVWTKTQSTGTPSQPHEFVDGRQRACTLPTSKSGGSTSKPAERFVKVIAGFPDNNSVATKTTTEGWRRLRDVWLPVIISRGVTRSAGNNTPAPSTPIRSISTVPPKTPTTPAVGEEPITPKSVQQQLEDSVSLKCPEVQPVCFEGWEVYGQRMDCERPDCACCRWSE